MSSILVDGTHREAYDAGSTLTLKLNTYVSHCPYFKNRVCEKTR